MTKPPIEQDSVVEQIEIAAPPERVWEAISDPRRLVQWWEEPPVSRIESWQHELRVGGGLSVRWKGSEGKVYLLKGTFLEIDPPRTLAYTWEGNWVEPATSQVRWELQATSGGTLVKVTHSGLRGYPEAIKDYSGGWPGVMRRLRGHVLTR